MNIIANFEKVSINQFEKDLPEYRDNYERIKIPARSTKGSAGYDFFVPFSFSVLPGQTQVIPTGIRAKIESGWVLQIYPRSSMGIKYNMEICNTVGIIDSDYYYANNEGHIIVKIRNDGDKTINIEEGMRIVQGIFVPYGITLDDNVTKNRHGGFGSTD